MYSLLFKTESLNSPCYTPDRKAGTCIFLQQCSSLYALIQKQPLYQNEREFLRQSQCGYNQQPMVCCPSTRGPTTTSNGNAGGSSNLLPQPGVCGVDTTNRIIGGEVTLIDEFPWMALLQYTKRKLNTSFKCNRCSMICYFRFNSTKSQGIPLWRSTNQ